MGLSSRVLLCWTIIILVLISKSDGIRCYVCNSMFETSCGDPFFPSNVPLINCDTKYNPSMTRPNMCKKNTRRISDGTYRVIRDCASAQEFSETEGQACITTPGGEFYCRCFGDACNGAYRSSNHLSWLALLLLGSAVTFFSQRLI